jgi:O-antigen/teichoic acid export membrane protein
MLCSQLVYTLSNDIRSLIIGKVFGSSDLAYYEQGKKYPAVIVDNIDVAIAKVMLPTFSRSQTDLNQLKEMLRKSQ